MERNILPLALLGVAAFFLFRPRRAEARARPVELEPVEVTGLSPDVERRFQQSLCPLGTTAMYVGGRWKCIAVQKQPLPQAPMPLTTQEGIIAQLQFKKPASLSDWHADGCGSY